MEHKRRIEHGSVCHKERILVAMEEEKKGNGECSSGMCGAAFLRGTRFTR